MAKNVEEVDGKLKAIVFPTDAERERLDILVEECAEVILVVSAIKRFGYESKNPDLLISDTNRESLTREMGDVMNAMTFLMDKGDVDPLAVVKRADKKSVEIKKWLTHN